MSTVNRPLSQFAIIVAGGSGSRMKSELPKQFMEVASRPILMHTLDAFRLFSPSLPLLVVLPASQFKTWKVLCDRHAFETEHELVGGGATRFHSVRNGLEAISADEGLVAVHDGVRPFVSKSTLWASFEAAAEYGSAVTCVALKDSVRRVEGEGRSQAVNRTDYRLVQTPQTFRLDWMRRAFRADALPHFTDCASVMEHSGYPIHLTAGAYENIKITTPDDLVWAEAFLKRDRGDSPTK